MSKFELVVVVNEHTTNWVDKTLRMDVTMNRRLLIGLVVVGAAIVVLALSRPGTDGALRAEPIRMAGTSFQTLWINNAIAKFIIEEGYGYPVETITVTTPVFQQSLENGQIDVQMELWRTNVMDWYTKVTEAGTVIDLGPTCETGKRVPLII